MSAFPRIDLSVRYSNGSFTSSYTLQPGVAQQTRYGDCPAIDVAVNKWALSQDFEALHKAFNGGFMAVAIIKFQSSNLPSADEVIGKLREQLFKSKADQKAKK